MVKLLFVDGLGLTRMSVTSYATADCMELSNLVYTAQIWTYFNIWSSFIQVKTV